MAKPKKSAPIQPLVRPTEANVARLGLISIQERIPADFTRWKYEFEIDGQVGELSCFSAAEYGGVPHGLDGDIANALIDIFIEQGTPENATISTTGSQILARAGLHNNGHYHAALTESLARLRQATYTMTHAWRDHEQQRWTSGTFSYILAYEYTSSERLTLNGSTILNVTLANQIARSIRSKYVKPLDYAFLATLERPLTRALYRLLDAKRHDPRDLTRSINSYSVNLLEWANECKIVDLRTDKIRRTLEGAHQELKERGYLQDITYEGRGKNQTVTYSYAPTSEPLDEEARQLVDELVRERVTRPRAVKLVAEYGSPRIQARIKKFRALLASGYKPKNPSAVLIDVIQDDEGKYMDPLDLDTNTKPDPAEQQRRLQETAEAIERERSAAEEQMTLQDRADRAIRTIQLLFKTHLDTKQLTKLHSAFLAGELDPATVEKGVTKAVFEKRQDDVLQHLASLL
ncbi:replication initiator protein A [Deinococcus cavernae]|uniref:replication initiator protein A n=1 Tax=Deinococcus cavernae TaxID=2320857 RepID=UPI001315022F|nr:replication initiator protein A [Deinococcus cavernae]